MCDRFLHVIFVSQNHDGAQARYDPGIISGEDLNARLHEDEDDSDADDCRHLQAVEVEYFLVQTYGSRRFRRWTRPNECKYNSLLQRAAIYLTGSATRGKLYTTGECRPSVNCAIHCKFKWGQCKFRRSVAHSTVY
jgi:hypothetical protein